SRARPTRPPRRRMAATEFSSRSRTRSTPDRQWSSRPRPRAGSHTEDGGSRSRWRAERSLVATALEHERQLDEPVPRHLLFPPKQHLGVAAGAPASRGIETRGIETRAIPCASSNRSGRRRGSAAPSTWPPDGTSSRPGYPRVAAPPLIRPRRIGSELAEPLHRASTGRASPRGGAGFRFATKGAPAPRSPDARFAREALVC